MQSEEVVVRGPILARCGAAFLGAFVGLVGVDRGVAYWDRFEGEQTVGAIVPHPQLGWTNRPLFVNDEFETHLDRFGLRNDEIPTDADPTEVRIAGFGASRLYGAGGALQSWCWHEHLERELNATGSDPVRVLNGGVIGDVYANGQIELAANARITGNVYYRVLEMAKGAEVNGSLVHQGQEEQEPRLQIPHDAALELDGVDDDSDDK